MAENNMQNGYNTVPIVQASPAQPITRPAIKRTGGGKLATIAMIISIVTCATALVSVCMVFAFAYGRENQTVIMTAFCSMALAVPAFIALIMGIIGKVRGGHIAKLIVTIVTILFTYLFIALDLYILLYYIGMTF